MMTSKAGVSRLAVWRAVMTRLAIVPLSLYAGKKTLSPRFLESGGGIGKP
jgi:hypothetical protein